MKIPFKWLKDYIDIPVSAKEFADAMIMTGNGVEAIEELGADIKGVLVGRSSSWKSTQMRIGFRFAA